MFRCPECTKNGETSDSLRITASVTMHIDVNGDEEVEDHDVESLTWEDTDQAECLDCGWSGTVADMTVAEADEAE
ncbi:MAG: hypothetical protein ABT940_08370 [Alphaproteobacteria bacterium]